MTRGTCAILIFGLVAFGCADDCSIGEACDRACPDGATGICGPSNLCLCGPIKPPYEETVAECRPPTAGELLISEIMIDGEPDESNEFVELVNTTGEDIRVEGISLISSRGQRMVNRLLFLTGCIPARGAVAVFSNETRWSWGASDETKPALEVSAFGFSNSADFRFELLNMHGVILDHVSGQSDHIKPGISLARTLDNPEAELILHNIESPGRLASPALCTNGARFEDLCIGQTEQGCRAPEAGDLRINEVLIDGAESEDEEFVELVNSTDQAVALSGVTLFSNRGDSMAPRINFLSGCLRGNSGVFFKSGATVSVQQSIMFEDTPPVFHRFGFSNTSDFRFQLVYGVDTILDTFAGSRAKIRPGVSVTRTPDLYGARIVLHDGVSQQKMSPGRCADGRSFVDGCQASALPILSPAQLPNIPPHDF